MKDSETVLAKDLCIGDVILGGPGEWKRRVISKILPCVGLDNCFVFYFEDEIHSAQHISYYDTIKRMRLDQLPY